MLKSKNLSVIGLQWGDEGKGKIVDYLSRYFDVIVRFQGGSNAGHTLVVDRNVYKLNLLPSGVLRDEVLLLIDQDVVIDPYALIQEINNAPVSINHKNLIISEECHLILSVHKELDNLYEDWNLDKDKIGTTGKGIGPCYEDKVARRGIRICDTYDENYLFLRVKQLIRYHNTIRRGSGIDEINREKIIKEIEEIIPHIKRYTASRAKVFDILNNKKVLFEGAQGCMLDISYGTYPFVTSSFTIKVSRSPKGNNYVLGVIKAYTTRIGNGPFPTEQDNDIGNQLRKVGKEIGTVSNRNRRCGWFDIVLARYAIEISSANSLALTKLDILDSFDEIYICTHYEYNNRRYDHLPSSPIIQDLVKPVYEKFIGWKQVTHGVTNINDLPKNAILYIKRIEQLLGIQIIMISTGASREETIMMIENEVCN